MSTNVDARGLACPQPVIETKKAIESIDSGIISVIVDNAAAKENVTKLAKASQCGVVIEEKDGVFYLTITKEKTAYQPVAASVEKTVYLITQNILGHGSEELGSVLIKSFFFTLQAGSEMPAAVMFINSGVKLAIAGSPVLEHLQTLSSKGTAILVCGTCLDYYGLKEQLVIGEISNMYAILDKLNTGKAITL